MNKKQNKKQKDNSQYVPQRDKISSAMDIRELNWSLKQKEFISQALDKDTKIMFVQGSAGTSKTLLSVYCSLKLLGEKRVSDIIYVRSAVESSDSHIGFLPGDANEKLYFYNLPFYDKLEELLAKGDIDRLEKDGRISMYPVNFARGMSWNAKVIIFDEAQNSSTKEIITLITRLGKFSKCFVLADPDQTDLPLNRAGGFSKLASAFSDEESVRQGIRKFEFGDEDIQRSELVKYIVKTIKIKGVTL